MEKRFNKPTAHAGPYDQGNLGLCTHHALVKVICNGYMDNKFGSFIDFNQEFVTGAVCNKYENHQVREAFKKKV